MSLLNFDDWIKRGRIGEMIFKEDFLDFLRIKYKDVTGCQQFQVIDTDYLASIGGKIEVKSNYKDNKQLVIEEHSNCDPLYGRITPGWFEKTEANLIVFVSKDTRLMVFMPMTERLRVFYRSIKHKFREERNGVSFRSDSSSRWQSSFRRVPFSALRGFLSVYKKIDDNPDTQAEQIIRPIQPKMPPQLTMF
jgi:hypothetical protein